MSERPGDSWEKPIDAEIIPPGSANPFSDTGSVVGAGGPVASRRRGRGWLLAVLICFPAILVAMCAGVGGLVSYWMFAPGAPEPEYVQARGDVPHRVPAWVPAALAEPREVDASTIAGLQGWLDAERSRGFAPMDIRELIDVDRYCQEMVRCGLGRGITGLTTRLWRDEIREWLDWDTLGSDLHLVAAEPLLENELRVLIVDMGDSSYYPEMYEVYLIRHPGGWKVYDWRNLFEPYSSAQLAALQFSTLNIDDTEYEGFIYDVRGMVFLDISPEEKAKRIIQARAKRKPPAGLDRNADYLACSWLCSYGTPEALLEFAEGLPEDRFPGVRFYRAWAALQLEDLEYSYELAEAIIDEFGWNPAGVILLAESATTPMQHARARDELLKNFAVCQHHDDTVMNLGRLADEETLSRVAQISRNPRPVVSFLDAIRIHHDDPQALLRQYAESNAESPGVLPPWGAHYIDYLLAQTTGNWQRQIDAGTQVLSSTESAWVHSKIYEDLAWNLPLDEALAYAVERLPEPSQLLEKVTANIATADWYEDVDWNALLDALARPDVRHLYQLVHTKIATAKALVQTDQHERAFALCKEIMLEHAGEMQLGDSEEADIFASLALEAALAVGKFDELLTLYVQDEATFLNLAVLLAHRRDVEHMQALVDHWAILEEESLWEYYYRSWLACARNDWPECQRWMERALSHTGWEGVFNPDASDDDAFTWPTKDLQSEYARFALRTGHLLDLVTAPHETWPDGWTETIDLHLSEFQNPALARAVGQLMVAKENAPRTRQVGHSMLAIASAAENDYPAAVAALRSACQIDVSQNSEYGEAAYRYQRTLIDWVAAWRQCDFLHEVSVTVSGTPVSDEVAGLRSLCTLARLTDDLGMRAPDSFGQMILQADDPFDETWANRPARLAALSRLRAWRDIQPNHPIDLWEHSFLPHATGVLLYDEQPAAMHASVAAALEQRFGPGDYEVDVERFVGADKAWSVPDEDVQWIVLDLPSKESLRSYSPAAQSILKQASRAVIVMGVPLDAVRPPVATMRAMVRDVATEAHPIAYYD
ncbi:MAG: hypothetical protein D6753_07315, partial [Planctomycetota bacterium]